jgi:hypothetical protein
LWKTKKGLGWRGLSLDCKLLGFFSIPCSFLWRSMIFFLLQMSSISSPSFVIVRKSSPIHMIWALHLSGHGLGAVWPLKTHYNAGLFEHSAGLFLLTFFIFCYFFTICNFLMHSQLLEGLKCESKWKTIKEGGVGTRSLAHNILRGRGACWSSKMGLGRVDKLTHSHRPAHNSHKVVSAKLEHLWC